MRLWPIRDRTWPDIAITTSYIRREARKTFIMSPAARQIVFINTAHTITHYSLLILPTAVLAMAVPGGRFGASYGPILALATGMFVLYGLLSLPQGWLAQRFGRKTLMTAFFLGTGISLIAAGFAHSPIVLAATLACAGAFAAIYHPIGTTMLVEAAGDKPGRSIGRERGLRQHRRRAGAGGDRVPGKTRSAGARRSSHQGCCARWPDCCGCGPRWHMSARTPMRVPSRQSRALWSAAPWWC